MINLDDELKSISDIIQDYDFKDKTIEGISSGDLHLFQFTDRLVILNPRDYNGCACVHVHFACTDKKTCFLHNYKFVVERAKEIGAKYITFATANKSIERMASKHGWAKIDQGPILSEWIIEI